jgi:hypothetical protein
MPERLEPKTCFIDAEFRSIESLLEGVRAGELLTHSRIVDGTAFAYGIEPSAGSFLQSTEAFQEAVEYHGEGPSLTFFSDGLSWAEGVAEARKASSDDVEVVFVRKSPTMQQCLGAGKVRLHDGSVVSYERSPVADFEDPLYRGEPAGVECGDWYSRATEEVAAVVALRAIKGMGIDPRQWDSGEIEARGASASSIESDLRTARALQVETAALAARQVRAASLT